MNDPLSVSPDTKHGPFVEKLNWLMLRVPSLFTTTVFPKLKANLRRPAAESQLLPPCLCSSPPHPTSVKTAATNHATASFFINEGPLISEVGTRRDANLSVVCSAPATTAASSNQERMPSKSGDHDKVLLV